VKAYKYKLRLNARFLAACERTLEVCRELYNSALQERRDAWQINHVSVNYHTQRAQLPEIKAAREDVAAVYSQVTQDVLRRVEQTFQAFFRRVTAGETPGYPRFKGRDRFDSFCYPQSGFRLVGDKLHLSKLGSCRVRLSRPVEGTIKTCTVKREADGWYVIFAVEENQCRYLPQTGEAVGVDVGLEHFATLSTGETIENPRHLKHAEQRLKTAQRQVSRRPNKRSHRRRKAVALLAKQHQKVRRQRQDFHHKAALRLIREFDRIAVEDLNILGLVKNHHPACAISDAAWHAFFLILTSKAAEAGRQVVKVAPQFTSQDCAKCGQRVRKSLSTREHRCLACGFVAHRDYNAALNIQRRGTPFGDGRRLPREPRISTSSRQA
jgi:putative transposase